MEGLDSISMKIFIKGKLDSPGKFRLTAKEEGGEVIFDDIISFRGNKATPLDAEFEILYQLLSPANKYKIYPIYSTTYKYIVDWLERGKAGMGSNVCPFEIEVVNYQLKKHKAKVIYERI